jgi:hypothetical protein
MSTTDQFLIALQAYQEIQAELHSPEATAAFIAPDPLDEEPLPPGSLLLGLGEDGLPLSLDLFDPTPGPLLVAGEDGCGRTALLQSLAAATDIQPDFQFGVITPFPDEWRAQEALAGCLGIWPSYHPSTAGFLSRLLSWAEVLPDTRQAILLCVDDLDLMTLASSPRHALRCLLANGPQAHLWPLVSVNPARMTRLGSILEYFQTRILGRTRRPQEARLLIDDPQVDLASLQPGAQFILSWPQGCLRFWLPPTEGVSDERGNALV